LRLFLLFFFFQAEDGIRDFHVTGVQTCALPISDLAVGDSLIVKKGNPLKLHSYADIVANAKVRLAGGRGTLNTRNAIDAGVPTSQITYLGDAQAMLSALLADRVDAATLSAPSVVGLLQDPKLQGVERAQPFTGLVRNGVPAMMY